MLYSMQMSLVLFFCKSVLDGGFSCGYPWQTALIILFIRFAIILCIICLSKSGRGGGTGRGDGGGDGAGDF